MKYYIAVTDPHWFSHLSSLPEPDEANFWTPSGRVAQYPVGTPWLFKLKGIRKVVGGGYFRYATQLPLGIAWDYFEEKNGAPSLDALQRSIARNRETQTNQTTTIGCIMLSEPFFWERDAWLDAPEDWKPNTQTRKIYDTEDRIGGSFWLQVQERLPRPAISFEPRREAVGAPRLVIPRLGQGEFRSIVLDAYGRRCAVTGERAWPALEAAHIVPFSQVREHDPRNALLLRADVHRLFDQGYVTVTQDLNFLVSRAVRDEFENGRDYYALHGKEIAIPASAELQPSRESLARHRATIFKG